MIGLTFILVSLKISRLDLDKFSVAYPRLAKLIEKIESFFIGNTLGAILYGLLFFTAFVLDIFIVTGTLTRIIYGG